MATTNARIQFSTDSIDTWTTINPTLREGEPVLAKTNDGRYALYAGNIGGSLFTESVLIWDETKAEGIIASAQAAADEAGTYCDTCKTSATRAAESATEAATSATNAANSATEAAKQATAAETSAENASVSEKSAAYSAEQAQKYAERSDAAAQADKAAESATEAKTAAANATSAAKSATSEAAEAKAKAQEAIEAAEKAEEEIKKLTNVFVYKGTVETYDDLPTENNTGDVWNVQKADKTHGIKAGDNVAWTGEAWDNLGGTCDMSEYALTADQQKDVVNASVNGATVTLIARDGTNTALTVTDVAHATAADTATKATTADSATTAASATKASQDGQGNTISTTYAKKADLATVATSGSYNDLTDKPTSGGGTLNDIMPKNAAAHNSVYRGEDLTEYFDSGEMSAAMADGSFDNIFIGDYIIKTVTIDGIEYADVKWLVADLDYYINRTHNSPENHHALMIPSTPLAMRKTIVGDTTSGFANSVFFTTVRPLIASGIKSAFGSIDHVVDFGDYVTNAVDGDTGYATDMEIKLSTTSDIPNQVMIYGYQPLQATKYDIGMCDRQLAIFQKTTHYTDKYNCTFWLRDIVGGNYVRVTTDGIAASDTGYTSNFLPYFLLY